MALEINLVPDIKNEMIKTLKLRNLIFFLCIIVASASAGITLIFGTIVGGQTIAINNKKSTIDTLSEKLNSFSDRDDYLTIKDQLGNIASVTENKRVASRTFNILSALIPIGNPDSIEISELKINFEEGVPSLTLEAQANAGQAPFIDYNVLDAFKKSMKYMRYDYGSYVDKEGNTIPAYCIIERDPEGALLNDPARGKYAFWTIFEENCNNLDDEDLKPFKSNDVNLNTVSGYNLEDYNGQKVVRIWRTPQVEWYSENPKNSQPQMTEDGQIKNVAHFDSKCINYKLVIKKNVVTKIDDSDNTCILVPGEDDNERITILESSNGRDSSEQLVLRFLAVINLAPEVYNFNNQHMLALPPAERRNVTDSYVQLQTIFGERAKDCQEGDAACNGNEGN